ncbi:hypothetical protein P5G65_23770 [Paenibacillus chondroitinus]|uniref:Core-binding (CB) domain-containing protein n=1 Tax=Paenibacillus chondroitinus TaxID=59842 RepID=A0ABU6DIW2_9BACL|nr:hypothetical protein [Paenibacillus chondroitinus]MCY9659528.1 hypothetical protein [Paenibacillus anseongense]MEB4796923.1 hypothetical protein [Paenibacillus chondroitinus]
MKQKEAVVHMTRSEIHYRVRSVKVELFIKVRDSKPYIRQHAVIVLLNSKNNREIIHPITQFIFEKWKYKEYNTQKIHANNLSSFLNWVITQGGQMRLKSLEDLKLKHASAFLNYLTKQGKSRITVVSAQRTLTHFYHYLSKKKLLRFVTQQEFEMKRMPQTPNKKYIVPPFKGVIMPSKEIQHIAHMIPEKYILPFLETVVQVANPIALGVYLQMFGGIRQGEQVNVVRSDITSIGSYGAEGLVIKLRKKILRADLIDSSGSAGVKKERNQVVFPISDWLPTLYKYHLEQYEANDGSNALFVNRDGKAMSGRGYRYFFEKAKEHFLDALSLSKDPSDKVAALKLREYKWSTHIGRGIFTNLLAEEAHNPYDIALPRGDSNLSSSMVYQGNTLRMKENLENRMEDLYKDYLPKLVRE